MSLDDLLADLRKEYIAELPAKIAVIESLLQKELAPELKDAFHKLKGTGKTYGLPEISELAAVVEEACLLDPGTGRRQAERALPLLRDIARTRHAGQAFVLTTDERWVALRSAA